MIDITQPQALEDLKTNVNAVATQVTGVASQVGTVATQVGSVETKVDAVDTKATDIQTKVGRVDTALGDVTDTAGDNTVFGKMKSVLRSMGEPTDVPGPPRSLQERLASIDKRTNKPAKAMNSMVSAAPGTTAKIKFQTDTGLAPKVTIYDPSNAVVAQGVTLTEVGTTGVYEYKWPISKTATLGNYTALITETTNSSVDSIAIDVRQASAVTSDTSGAASAASSYAQKTLSEMDGIKTNLAKLMDEIKKVNAQPVAQEGQTGSTTSPVVVQQFQQGIQTNVDKTQNVAKEKGINLGDLLNLTKDQKAELQSQTDQMRIMKNQIERIQAVVEALNMTSGSEKPVIKDWMEVGSR